MKSNSVSKFTLVIAALLATVQFAGATVYTWNWTNGVSPDMNWSDSLNWSPVGVPGAADSLIFNSVNSGGACVAAAPGLNIPGGGQSQLNILNFNSVVDSGFDSTISSVVCSNLASTYQNILITNNATLTITNSWILGNGSNVVTTGAVTPGTGGIDYGTVNGNVTIAGTNATLLMNHTNETLWVAEGSGNNSSSIYFALDMSALDYFNATISRLLVGVPAVNRPGGTIYLAATNNITAEYQTTSVLTSDTVGTGAIVVGDATSNGGGAADDLYLGLVNTISADTIAVGRQKQAHSLIAFNPNLTGPLVPTATFGGFTANRVLTWDIGDGVANSGTDTTVGAADFSLGIVNAAVSNMYVGKGPSAGTGANASTGTLTFGAGTINIDSLYVGYHNNTSAPFGNGTVNVNTNSAIDDYATLVVNSNLYLTYAIPTAPGAPGSVGTLNITGGTVFANNISSATNGHSALNMTAGTLVITNFAGTVTAPISNLTVGGTIQLSVSGGVPEMVASNLNIAAPVTVNIAAVPFILKYPAQYPLIKYFFPVNGDPTQVTLGSLPAGSPSYAGYLTNNSANSSIDLVLTTGALVTGADIWTGAASSNWDTTSINWSLSGNPANFDEGFPVQFDDSAHGPTNVNLATTVSPAQITVSNTVLAYTFSGPGALAGPGALVKDGTNTLLITNTGNNTFSGGLIISNGTVQFGNGGADGNLPGNGAAILDDGTLVFDQSPNVNVPSPITGTGSVIQEGLGVLDLTASNSYAGLTLVDSGTLLLDGWLNGGLLTNAPGTTVGGNGTNLGPFTVAGIINPGDVSAFGTLTAGDGLTLAPGALAYFDLSTIYNTPGSGYNDLLQVTGDLNANGNSVWADIQGIPIVGSEWEVIAYTGSLHGAINPVLAGTHFTGVVDTSVTGEVNVSITGGTGANLKWDSTSSGAWDNLTSNWFNFTTLAPDFFGSGDNVQFDDSVPNVQTNITIAAGVAVYPNSMTNISSVNNYTISGLGTIAGPSALVKDGASTLTISTTNSFSGGVTVLGGTLRAGSGTALGSTVGTTTTIENGATFDLNAQNMGAEQFIVSGAGIGGKGALVNNSATAQEDAFQLVTLAGDTTFGGIGRWDMRAGTTTLNTQGTPCNVTKVGTNQVSLVGCNCSDPNLENINVINGTFAIQTTSSQYGDPNGAITVSSNAQIEVWGLTAGLDKNILLLDGGQLWSENNQTIIAGTVYLTNNAANTAPGTGIITNDANGTGFSLVVSSTITGPGNLLKTGAGTTELTAVNTYTGGTTIAAGTLLVAGGASLATTINFNVGSAATFDVSQISPWSLSTGQTLLGSGTVNGSVTVPAGATIAPGTPSATGTLTIVNGVTLAGNTVMKVNGLTGASDTISSPSGGSIVLGGSLVISNLNNVAPKIGQTFTLFSTPALSGTFAGILPATPGAGLLWNTNNLAVNGTISVVAGIRTLDFGATSRNGNVVTISGVGGTPNAVYYVLTSTNLASPLNGWTPIATNNFNSSGDFSYNVTNSLSGSQQFYTIEQP